MLDLSWNATRKLRWSEIGGCNLMSGWPKPQDITYAVVKPVSAPRHRFLSKWQNMGGSDFQPMYQYLHWVPRIGIVDVPLI